MVLLGFHFKCSFWENSDAFCLLDKKTILQQLSWLENPTTGKNTWFQLSKHQISVPRLRVGQRGGLLTFNWKKIYRESESCSCNNYIHSSSRSPCTYIITSSNKINLDKVTKKKKKKKDIWFSGFIFTGF